MINIAVLISGRGSNMEMIVQNSLTSSLKNICCVKAVISNRSDAIGLETAASLGIKTVFIDAAMGMALFEEKLIPILKELKVDYLILAGFMKILSPNIIDCYRNRIINIHPADTAKYRGAKGYQWAYNNQLKETFLTVHFVDEGLDSGEVIGKRRVDLSSAKTSEEVESLGLQAEHEFYSEMIAKVFLTSPVFKGRG